MGLIAPLQAPPSETNDGRLSHLKRPSFNIFPPNPHCPPPPAAGLPPFRCRGSTVDTETTCQFMPFHAISAAPARTITIRLANPCCCDRLSSKMLGGQRAANNRSRDVTLQLVAEPLPCTNDSSTAMLAIHATGQG
jgi:hypothetical protein